MTPLTPTQRTLAMTHYHYAQTSATRWHRITNLPYYDLLQAGSMGLLRAIANGNPDHPQFHHLITKSIWLDTLKYIRTTSMSPETPTDILPDVVGYHVTIRDHNLHSIILDEIANLSPPRDRLIAEMYFDLDQSPSYTMAGIARYLEVTRQAVQSRILPIIRRLRVRIRKRVGKEELDQVLQTI